MRQLEFHFGEARSRDADTVLVTGAVQSNLVRIAAAAARRLGVEIHIQLEDRVAEGGETYRTSGNLLLDRVLGAMLHPFPEGEDEAAAAGHEGLLLDPVYTGKAMAGLIAHVRSGRIAPGGRVLFVHTGGQPALFAYADSLGSWLSEAPEGRGF